jgi:hypothetical protein
VLGSQSWHSRSCRALGEHCPFRYATKSRSARALLLVAFPPVSRPGLPCSALTLDAVPPLAACMASANRLRHRFHHLRAFSDRI